MGETTSEQNLPERPDSPDKLPAEEWVKVVDRRGKTKLIPRSQYEERKRRRKKREPRKSFPYRDVFSLALIVVIMIVAIYIALKIVK